MSFQKEEGLIQVTGRSKLNNTYLYSELALPLNIKTLDILRKDVVYFPEKDRIKLFPLIR